MQQARFSRRPRRDLTLCVDARQLPGTGESHLRTHDKTVCGIPRTQTEDLPKQDDLPTCGRCLRKWRP